jgi:hypothetical protein
MMPVVKVWKSCRGNDAVIDRVFWSTSGVEWSGGESWRSDPSMLLQIYREEFAEERNYCV